MDMVLVCWSCCWPFPWLWYSNLRGNIENTVKYICWVEVDFTFGFVNKIIFNLKLYFCLHFVYFIFWTLYYWMYLHHLWAFQQKSNCDEALELLKTALDSCKQWPLPLIMFYDELTEMLDNNTLDPTVMEWSVNFNILRCFFISKLHT